MAYATGSVNGLQALFDALISFLTTTAGWTLLDTLSTGDKVVKSSGSSGKETLIYRLTISKDPGNPYKWGLYYLQDAIIARGYMTWDTTAHTGTIRYGQWGPFAIYHSTYSSPYYVRFAMLSDDQTLWPTFVNTNGLFAPNDNNYQMSDLDERASVVMRNGGGGNINYRDLRTGESWSGSGSPYDGNMALSGQWLARAYSSTGEEVYYMFGYGSGYFQSYNANTNTWTRLNNAPWGTPANANNAAACVWDGNDTIYALHGQDTTSFAKYSISGGTWTSLAAAPVARAGGHNGCPQNIYYLPASLTGRANDIIVCPLATNTSNLYYYDVVTNAWTLFSAPFSMGSSAGITFDNQKYMHFFDASNGNAAWYTLDVSKFSSTISYTNIGALSYENAQVFGVSGCNPPTGSVFASKLTSTTYYFLADADSFFVATTENGRDHWMQCGMYDSNYSTVRATTTASVSPGFVVSVPVDDSSQFAVGDVINIAGGGTGYEQTTILSIPDATHFTANILKSHGSGARIGIDVAPYVITSGHGLASVPFDAQGYLTDRITPSFFTMPLFPQANLAQTSPSGRGYYQFSPLMISQTKISRASHQDTPGTLRSVYAIYRSGVSSGDTITIKGKQYIVLIPFATSKYAASNYCAFAVAFGPIN